jgi:hypothetical protein
MQSKFIVLFVFQEVIVEKYKCQRADLTNYCYPLIKIGRAIAHQNDELDSGFINDKSNI